MPFDRFNISSFSESCAMFGGVYDNNICSILLGDYEIKINAKGNELHINLLKQNQDLSKIIMKDVLDVFYDRENITFLNHEDDITISKKPPFIDVGVI